MSAVAEGHHGDLSGLGGVLAGGGVRPGGGCPGRRRGVRPGARKETRLLNRVSLLWLVPSSPAGLSVPWTAPHSRSALAGGGLALHYHTAGGQRDEHGNLAL